MYNFKCAKVISLCPHVVARPNANNNPTTLDEWTALIKLLYEGELNFDPGVDLDVFFVWNRDPGTEEPGLREFVYKFDGKKINRGRIHVHERHNTGIGFHGLTHVLRETPSISAAPRSRELVDPAEYKYWCYQEDDHHIVCDGYYGQAVAQLEKDEELVGVSFSPILNDEPRTPLSPNLIKAHFGGFFGVYPYNKLNLDTLHEGVGLQFSEGHARDVNLQLHQQTEVGMSVWLYESNGKTIDAVQPLEGYSTYPINWKFVTSYVRLREIEENHPHQGVDRGAARIKYSDGPNLGKYKHFFKVGL